MARAFQDRTLREWEAYSSTDRGGGPTPGRIVFRCLSDPRGRAKAVEVEGSLSRAEARVAEASEDELRDLLEQARPLR